MRPVKKQKRKIWLSAMAMSILLMSCTALSETGGAGASPEERALGNVAAVSESASWQAAGKGQDGAMAGEAAGLGDGQSGEALGQEAERGAGQAGQGAEPGAGSVAGQDSGSGLSEGLKPVRESGQGDIQGTGQAAGQQPNGPAAGSREVTQELAVHFLDVGQGDATLIVCGEEAMLIDAGDNGQGTFVQNYLQKQGVESLKYVVCTHPDEDHIGGMDVILYKFDCGTVLMTEEEKDTNTYRDVVDTMSGKGYKRTAPVTGQQYTLGDAMFTILGPDSPSSDSNDNSIAILLTHGENTFLFTGDAEEEEEEAIADGAISPAADVYKAGHHGSRTSSSKKLLDAVSPAYAVISCGEGNSYGHPHAETLNNLRTMGVQVFRTDEQGSIIAVSDGREISWNCSPSETWQAGEPTGSSGTLAGQPGQGVAVADGSGATTSSGSAAGTGAGGSPESEAVASEPVSATSPDTVGTDYICNLNTRKFHYPGCSSVKKMKESNKLPVHGTRDEIISQGYEPCKICKP